MSTLRDALHIRRAKNYDDPARRPRPAIREVSGLREAKQELRSTSFAAPATLPPPQPQGPQAPRRPTPPDHEHYMHLDENGQVNLPDDADSMDEEMAHNSARDYAEDLARYREALAQYEVDMEFFNAREELARGVSPPRDPPPVPIPPEPYQRMSESERNQLLNEGLSEGEIDRIEHANLLRSFQAERDYAEELGLGNAPRTARRTARLAQAASDAGRTPTHVSEPSVPPASSRGVPSSPDGSPPDSSKGGGGGGGGGSNRGVAGHHRRLEETVRNTTIAKRPAGGGESTYKYQQTRTLKSDHPIPMP